MVMRTFEFKEGKSAKFWNIELAVKAFTVTYGRLGTPGQKQTKRFPDAAKAQAAHDKLVAEKLGKGYVETSGKKAMSPLQKSLEQAILDNPDDLATHAAYADFLTEQGDPRGEFIQVQLALEDPQRSPKERKQLQAREKELLKKHGRDWLGELAPFLMGKDVTGLSKFQAKEQKIGFAFSRGWLETLAIKFLPVQLSRVLARAPESRLLRRLVIESQAYQNPIHDPSEIEELEEYDGWYEPGADAPEMEYSGPGPYPLRRSPYLGNVRVFQLGEQVPEKEWQYPSCHTDGEVAVDLVKKMPRLEELYLLAHNVDTKVLFKLPTLTHLRVLQVYHCDNYPLDLLAKNAGLTNLQQLLLHPHGLDDEEPYIRLDGLRAITRSPHLKSLTHLSIHCADVGDPGCQEIVNSGILKRLKVLDLRHGEVTDKGAAILAACPDLKKLELLDLNRNALTKKGQAALKKVGIPVKVDNQQTADDLQYRMYLFEADPE
ncbi:hypothetical protein AYO44_08110 [Planctomycetaceae bacterium SCGC AG-212-F19]|nr:hypothetical protein AYO44_08110 [Planctomycetaceae bacterium SCGC AG-212-F19]